MNRLSVLALFCILLIPTGAAMATEEPPFTVSIQRDGFELRDYPPMIAAEVNVEGSRDAASNAGFRLLAGYIFGGNTRREGIAMTAPVMQTPSGGVSIAMTAPVMQSGADGKWLVRFIMPRAYTLDSLPKPDNPKVRLVPLPASRMAVVKFSGLARAPDVASKTDELRGFIASQHLEAIGLPVLARYNPPWTPWFMRRNEVHIPVRVE